MPLYQRAPGYGFPGIRVDGNDVLACLAVTRWALEECRSGNGPVMIEAFTYRMDAHTTSDDPTRYRMADERSTGSCWTRSSGCGCTCPRQGVGDQEFFDAVDAEADELAAALPGALHRDAQAAAGADVLQRLRRAASPSWTPSATSTWRTCRLRFDGTVAARDDRDHDRPWPRR